MLTDESLPSPPQSTFAVNEFAVALGSLTVNDASSYSNCEGLPSVASMCAPSLMVIAPVQFLQSTPMPLAHHPTCTSSSNMVTETASPVGLGSGYEDA